MVVAMLSIAGHFTRGSEKEGNRMEILQEQAPQRQGWQRGVPLTPPLKKVLGWREGRYLPLHPVADRPKEKASLLDTKPFWTHTGIGTL